MEEIWKPINNYEGYYEVSNRGNVRSYHSYSIGMSDAPAALTLNKDRKGYNHVTLVKGGNKKYMKVHRLVAEAFIPNHESKPQVNHINGINDDNHVNNLEWVTNHENILHAKEIGRYENHERNFKKTK